VEAARAEAEARAAAHAAGEEVLRMQLARAQVNRREGLVAVPGLLVKVVHDIAQDTTTSMDSSAGFLWRTATWGYSAPGGAQSEDPSHAENLQPRTSCGLLLHGAVQSGPLLQPV
jgi:hypothetical protein